jgi:AcrR family transcriptional regulator
MKRSIRSAKVKDEDKKGTKAMIRDVSIDLFSEKGFNAVSVRDIADNLPIHKSTIYSHYKSKEEIMDSIIESLIDEFKYNSNQIPLEDLIDKMEPEILLNSTIRPMIEQIRIPRIRKILRLMWIELYQNEKCLDFLKNQYIAPTILMFENVFQLMMDKGYIKQYDAKTLAKEFFYHALYLLFECFILNYNEASYETLIDSLLEKASIHIKFIFDMVKIDKEMVE